MVTSVSINQGGRFGKQSQRLGERKVQAELTEKQMQVSILEELLAAVDFAAVVFASRFGSTIPESGEVLNFQHMKVHLGVSENGGTPKSSILIGFSIKNHPFWGTPIFGNIHLNQINI